MIPAIDLAREAGKKVFIYFPPNHKSSNLRILAGMRPTWLERAFWRKLLSGSPKGRAEKYFTATNS